MLTVSGTGAMPALEREYTEQELVSVETVILDPALTSLDAEAFRGCTRLRAITLPEGLSAIGAAAFDGCRLETITLPAGLASIGSKAFYNCRALKEIHFTGTAPEIASDAFYYVGAMASNPTGYVGATAFYPTGDASWTAAFPRKENHTGKERTYQPSATFLPFIRSRRNWISFRPGDGTTARISEKSGLKRALPV